MFREAPAARRDPYSLKLLFIPVWTSRFDCWNWAECSSAVGVALEYGNRRNSSLDILSIFLRGYHQVMFRRIQFSSLRTAARDEGTDSPRSHALCVYPKPKKNPYKGSKYPSVTCFSTTLTQIPTVEHLELGPSSGIRVSGLQ